jgi:hypothetical protein
MTSPLMTPSYFARAAVGPVVDSAVDAAQDPSGGLLPCEVWTPEPWPEDVRLIHEQWNPKSLDVRSCVDGGAIGSRLWLLLSSNLREHEGEPILHRQELPVCRVVR